LLQKILLFSDGDGIVVNSKGFSEQLIFHTTPPYFNRLSQTKKTSHNLTLIKLLVKQLRI